MTTPTIDRLAKSIPVERQRVTAALTAWINRQGLTTRAAGTRLGANSGLISRIMKGDSRIALEHLLLLWGRTGGQYSLALTEPSKE